MSEVAVSARSLSKDYVDAHGRVVRACQNLNFEAHGGEVFGILGTNGAGKTTCLRMLSTVLRPTGGDATVGGHSVTREPDQVRNVVGFLSADTGVYGRLSAREMVEYFGRLHELPEPTIARRLDEIADLLYMTPFHDRRCDKHVDLSCAERPHGRVLLVASHATVEQAHLQIREDGCAQPCVLLDCGPRLADL